MADVMSRMAQVPVRRPNNGFMTTATGAGAAAGSGFHSNKETDWSRVCDNVLDEFLADDDVFGLGAYQHERSSSDDSAGGVFAYSMSSGQSNPTTGTSPDPTWLEQVAVTAAALDNPMGIPPSMLAAVDACAIVDDTPSGSPTKPQMSINTHDPTSIRINKPQSFWERAVSKLERGAKVSSKKERLRTSRSHPDFLSLGGHPSPASVPGYVPQVPQVPVIPVPDHTLSVPRSRGRETGNGKKRSTSQLRSISRGRPQGVAKTGATAGGASNAINSGNASARKASLSPSKMMNPLRYRAGFQEAVLENLSNSPTKAARAAHHQSLPPPPPPPPAHLQQQLQQRNHMQQRSSFPASPPTSAQVPQQDFTAFGSTQMHPHAPAYIHAFDTEIMPLTSSLQQAQLHTPDASPFFGQPGQAVQSYFDHNVGLNNYTVQAVPLNDTQPVLTDRTQNRIGSFDFGFNNGAPGSEAWTSATFDQPSMTALHGGDVYAGVHLPTLQALEQASTLGAGLGITCDSTVFCPPTAAPQDYNSFYHNVQTFQPTHKTEYPAMPNQNGTPSTPQKHMSGSALRSESPSPPMTDSRTRRVSGGSRIRRVSKHRRTKSATSIPRASQNADRGGFVNFTPDDSNKILSGVAPSGSSKTKARREKEAADKRRRLSQAAIKAVLEAGGDAEELVKAGFDV